MKPPIEYRAPAAPEKAAKVRQRRKLVKTFNEWTPKADQNPPKPLDGPGRWVWVRDDQMVTKRSKTKSREYMREYMKKRRAQKEIRKKFSGPPI